MRATLLSLLTVLFLNTNNFLLATSIEDFDDLPGFPDYECQVIEGRFALANTEDEIKKLSPDKQSERLLGDLEKRKKNLRTARRLTRFLLNESPNARTLQKFQRLLNKYDVEMPALETVSDRIEAMAVLKGLLRTRIASVRKNIAAIDSCITRNSRDCSFSFHLAGNLDSGADVLGGGAAAIPLVTIAGAGGSPSSTTFEDLQALAELETEVTMEHFDDLSQSLKLFFFKTSEGEFGSTWVVRAYVAGRYVDQVRTDESESLPRQIGSLTLNFDNEGDMTTSDPEIQSSVVGPGSPSEVEITLYGFRKSLPSASLVTAVDQDPSCMDSDEP